MDRASMPLWPRRKAQDGRGRSRVVVLKESVVRTAVQISQV